MHALHTPDGEQTTPTPRKPRTANDDYYSAEYQRTGVSAYPPVANVSIGAIAHEAGKVLEDWQIETTDWGTSAWLSLGDNESPTVALELSVDDDYDLYLISKHWDLTPHIFPARRYDTVEDIAADVITATRILAAQSLVVAGTADTAIENLLRAEEALHTERSKTPAGPTIIGEEKYATLLRARIDHVFVPDANHAQKSHGSDVRYASISASIPAHVRSCTICGRNEQGLVRITGTTTLSTFPVCRKHHDDPGLLLLLKAGI
ncbi:hypothetical protein [Streptomyces sp. NPDC048272]|uniref:hypothetical protein n=1 Tax=Streptomyces sp. NPDC048272 TaxID=3154616 RepID=UPI00343A5791